MLDARILSLLSEDFDYWLPGQLRPDLVVLAKGFREDSSPEIRQAATSFLSVLLQTYDPRQKRTVVLPTGPLAIEELRAEIIEEYGSSFFAETDIDQDLARRLREWIKPAPYFEEKNETE